MKSVLRIGSAPKGDRRYNIAQTSHLCGLKLVIPFYKHSMHANQNSVRYSVRNLRAVYMSRASPLCRTGPLLTGSRLTYSFDIFLKLRSYGSRPARLGEIPPERSEISPLTGTYERIKRASPGKPGWER